MNIYEYQRPVGKIDDIPELRNEFIHIYDTKSHKDMAQFSLAYGQHILDITGFDLCEEITAAFEAIKKWIDGKVNYHAARNIDFGRPAREEKDPVKIKFFRTMQQIAGTPHVKYHALWATDFAITLINKMYPDNMDEVRKEREKQIEIIKLCTLP
jgi:hypothetical protein